MGSTLFSTTTYIGESEVTLPVIMVIAKQWTVICILDCVALKWKFMILVHCGRPLTKLLLKMLDGASMWLNFLTNIQNICLNLFEAMISLLYPFKHFINHIYHSKVARISITTPKENMLNATYVIFLIVISFPITISPFNSISLPRLVIVIIIVPSLIPFTKVLISL